MLNNLRDSIESVRLTLGVIHLVLTMQAHTHSYPSQGNSLFRSCRQLYLLSSLTREDILLFLAYLSFAVAVASPVELFSFVVVCQHAQSGTFPVVAVLFVPQCWTVANQTR